MQKLVHPKDALFAGEKPFPVLAACEHFAGSKKLIDKALALQSEYGPIFDITADCEDGAPAGEEIAHANMVADSIASPQNVFKRIGARIHDPAHRSWKEDVDILLAKAGRDIAYITIPKATSFAQAETAAAYVQETARHLQLSRAIPLHVLVETHGALRDVAQIATIPNLEVIDFGLMDFVSGHNGAIAASQMRSPGQFEHRLIVRAKAEVAAAALANGVVPSHNVCLNLKDADVVRQDASRARNELGYLRMWSIYPAQIKPIVEAMQPAYEEVADAAEILLAAQTADWGPTQYKGELHDRATYRYFWVVLEKAKATGMALPQAAIDRFFA
ncbi:CoA ester lyase [Variovorax sp. 770b2]|uniref:HpcH/HpaI aldolase/citrate lyase family protein n=1 Tax=Variovorax sp. 770b2 TaxID=1566271 RepID=UPI0008DF2F27|nr:aldolase/citrate lyase family protein [Variovorax sp. 770b2]SFP91856.1 citrate lyase subunit beta / citryl-CoA lyase [Variovorax sp. 770b2]